MASPRSSGRLLVGAVALIALVVFAPAIGGGFVWDDHRLIESNSPQLSSPDGWKTAFTADFWHVSETHGGEGDHRLYRPLLKLALIAQYRLFGLADTAGYHVVSLLLHALCSVLVFRWLLRRTGASAPPEVYAVLAGALVFVLHPVRVESVAWISGGSDLWTALCVLLALEAWDRSTGAVATALGTLGFLAALLFKESAAAVPLALVADAFWLAPTAEERRRRWRRVAIPLAAVTLTFLGRLLIVPLGDGGALHNLGSRPMRLFASFGQFTRMVLWPLHPSTQVGYIESSAYGVAPSYPGWAVALGATVIVALALVVLVAVFRRPSWRPLLADLGWFWIPALPMLNLIPLGGMQYTGERFLYLPGLGLAALVTRGGLAVLRRPGVLRGTFAVAFGALLVGYGAIVRARIPAFADELALWTAEYKLDPTNGTVLESLLTAASKSGRYDIAERMARESLALQRFPKAKAYMLVQWLRAKTDQSRNDPAAIQEVRAEADGLAAGRPSGELATLAAGVAAPGLEWVKNAPLLTLTRAFLALRALDFERAVELAALTTSNTDSRDVACRVMILARVSEHRWADARVLAALPFAPPAALSIIDAAERGAALPDSAGFAGALAVYQLGDPALARALARSTLETSPRAEELTRLLIAIDLDLKLFSETKQLVADHRRAEADGWAAETLSTIELAERLAGR